MAQETTSVEGLVHQASQYLREHGLWANYASDTYRSTGEYYQMITITEQASPHPVVAELVFKDGELQEASKEEDDRRQQIAGFISQVVTPLWLAVRTVYPENNSLLYDSRFNELFPIDE